MEGRDNEEWFQKCPCGKRFYQPSSYTHHIQGCSSYKKGVGSTLEIARARWAAKTARPKKGKEAITSWYGDRDLDVDHDISRDPAAGPTTETPVPKTTATEPVGRGFRVIRPVERYGADFEATSTMLFHFVPEVPPGTVEELSTTAVNPAHRDAGVTSDAELRGHILQEAAWKRTQMNDFGLWKHYWTVEARPHDPESHLSHLDVMDNHELDEEADIQNSPNPRVRQVHHQRYHPFPNLSSYLIGQWFWNEHGKSRESLQQLVEVITSEGFKPQDLLSANWNNIHASLTSSEFEDQETPWVDDGGSWQTASVTVNVPFNSQSLQPGSQTFTIDGFRYRPLVSVIRAKLQDSEQTDHFHFVPYDLRWQPPGSSSDSRVYGELYHSQAFLDAYREIQSLPPEPNEDGLPRYVVGLMFASDQTMLASFGDAKLWPVYMLYGNESKYRRSKVSLGLFEEVAYFRTLPDHFADWYIRLSGKKTVSRTLATHIHRELFHEQWRLLLDDEFIEAYRHGLVIDCFDGVRRRFYPRIMTYSADYPERTVVLSIRTLGQTPCCKCTVSADEIPNLGQPGDRQIRTSRQRVDGLERQTQVDKARRLIYRGKHLSVNSKPVEAILQPTSLVPTQNAFSERLLPDGFNMYDMAAPDILHEVEIGVWKSLFQHLLRILEVEDAALTNVVNRRYRQVPTFGRDTIRRFSNSVSLLKQLAARDYEDMLQCAFPVFEGLLPGEHGVRLQNLLFTLGYWHGLAKLRMHTEFTLDILDRWTSFLGEDARDFVQMTCSDFETRELKREYEARKRAQARRSKKASAKKPETKPTSTSGGIGRQPRTWNINTPKFHALGDVVPYIRRYGTTDSYSTQLSERFHRVSKSRYRKTNKKDIHRQLSRLQTRQARLKKLRRQIDPPAEEMDARALYTPQQSQSRWYFVGKSQNKPVHLAHFIRTNINDWAVKGFLLSLKNHLFPRLILVLLREAKANLDVYDNSVPTLEALSKSFSADDVNHLHFHSERIYRHSVFKIRFTTYDCRAEEDIFNPSTSRRDFMCIREPSSLEGSSGTEDRDLGQVHWIVAGGDLISYGFAVSFAQAGSPLAACDFLDPVDVLRAAHIIPRFAAGLVHDPLNKEDQPKARAFSKCAQDRSDWKEYFVNRFADRDILMRFHHGLSPGHLSAPPLVPAPTEDAPMEWDPERQHAEESDDAAMTVDLPTDSEDSNYDQLSLASHLSEEEDSGDREEALSDLGEPDSENESEGVYL
ncbi:hypothetical protein NMY22_g8186 [Coprinellus aureogranulatus]|nr:hypothetical protein NMY22_g8186 [Coprinellus aureogranulatus]